MILRFISDGRVFEFVTAEGPALLCDCIWVERLLLAPLAVDILCLCFWLPMFWLLVFWSEKAENQLSCHLHLPCNSVLAFANSIDMCVGARERWW